jgi:hypothetical protein
MARAEGTDGAGGAGRARSSNAQATVYGAARRAATSSAAISTKQAVSWRAGKQRQVGEGAGEHGGSRGDQVVAAAQVSPFVGDDGNDLWPGQATQRAV